MLGSSAAKVGEGSGPEGPFRRLSVLLERRMVAHFGLVLPLGLLSSVPTIPEPLSGIRIQQNEASSPILRGRGREQ